MSILLGILIQVAPDLRTSHRPLSESLALAEEDLLRSEIGSGIEEWHVRLKRAHWKRRAPTSAKGRRLAIAVVPVARKLLEARQELDLGDLCVVEEGLSFLAGIVPPPEHLLPRMTRGLDRSEGATWEELVRNLSAAPKKADTHDSEGRGGGLPALVVDEREPVARGGSIPPVRVTATPPP